MIRRLALVIGLLAAGPGSLAAQSLFNAAGLGLPSEPGDARSRALGGVGIGLRGPALQGSDPAAAAYYLLPSASLTAQPAWVEFRRSGGSEEGTFRGTRFPALGIAFPIPRGLVATLAFESFLDQRFEAASPSTIDLGGGPVEVRDEFQSLGGVSQLRAGLARRLGPNVAVGLSASRYGGSVTRRITRTFGAGVDTTVVQPFQTGGFWSWSGAALSAGASVLLGNVAHVSGSLTWSSDLEAEASDDTDGASRSYDLPVQVRVGATAALAPGLSVSAGLSHADWSSMAGDLADGASAGPSTSYGAGVELTRASLLGRTAPLRVGYRRIELPFSRGGGAPTETVWAGGVGLNLSQAGELVRAGVDLSLERGDRSDATLTERFWRATLTVRVAGF